jgi:hypothetical protein
MTAERPSLATLRRLYHHLVHGGTITALDQQWAGVMPLTVEYLSRCIQEIERKDLSMQSDALAHLHTVATALVQDAQVVTEGHYAAMPIPEAAWAALYASISAVKALLPNTVVRPIPEHMIGRVWRVMPFTDEDGNTKTELAIDDAAEMGALLVVADSAEEAIANIMP